MIDSVNEKIVSSSFSGDLASIRWNVSAKIDILHQLSFPWLPYVYIDFNWLINKSCSKRPKCLISSLPFVHTFFSRAEQPRLVKRSSSRRSSNNGNNIHTHILSLLGDERTKKWFDWSKILIRVGRRRWKVREAERERGRKKKKNVIPITIGSARKTMKET